MKKKSSKKLYFIKIDSIFILLAILILVLGGGYLAYKKYSAPKFRILPIDTDIQNPNLKNPDYLNKLLSKEWFWVETVQDSSVGIKPNNFSAFKIKFNSDLTFGSSTDCNSVGGTFEIFENKINFKNIVTTEKYCMKSKETEYLDGLQNVSEINFNEKNEMILKFKNSNSFMRFK